VSPLHKCCVIAGGDVAAAAVNWKQLNVFKFGPTKTCISFFVFFEPKFCTIVPLCHFSFLSVTFNVAATKTEQNSPLEAKDIKVFLSHSIDIAAETCFSKTGKLHGTT